MAEVDISSYKQPEPPSVLNTIGQIQQVQSQALGIEKQKLDLINQHYGYMLRELNSLGPDATPDDLIKYGQNIVKQGLVKPDMFAQFVQSIPTDPAQVPQFKRSLATRLLDTQAAINHHYGTPGYEQNGQTITPTLTRPLYGDVRASGPPRQQQNAPSTETRDTEQFLSDGVTPNPNYGQSRVLGPVGPIASPGTVTGPLPIRSGPQATPGPLPVGPINDPRILGQSNNFGGNVTGVTVENAPVRPRNTLPIDSGDNFNNRFAQSGYPPAKGPATGMPSNFEEGKKGYTEDQALATQKLTAVKPAIMALSLMKDLRSGPGTETWNKAVAFAKANGIIKTDKLDDSTAIYQEVNKYLNQYIQGNGTRSDADLAQKEVSNPNVGTQINPALVKLTQTQVARDRIEAARSGAFKNEDGHTRNDFQNYNDHRSKFPPKMDERAFIIDQMEPDDRQKLLADMTKKANDGNKAAIRFFDSLKAAKRSGVLQ